MQDEILASPVRNGVTACFKAKALSMVGVKGTDGFLMSGDSDFISLANLLRGKGKRVIVISTRWHIAHDLIQAADFYCDLKKFQKYWRLDKKPIKSQKALAGLSDELSIYNNTT